MPADPGNHGSWRISFIYSTVAIFTEQIFYSQTEVLNIFFFRLHWVNRFLDHCEIFLLILSKDRLLFDPFPVPLLLFTFLKRKKIVAALFALAYHFI